MRRSLITINSVSRKGRAFPHIKWQSHTHLFLPY
jgi:hypothetical protein